MTPLIDFRSISSGIPPSVVFAFVVQSIVIGMKRTLSTARVIRSLPVGVCVEVTQRAVGDEVTHIPCSDIVAVGALLLIIFIAPLRMAPNRNACVRDLQERKEITLLDSVASTATPQSQIAVRRTRSALDIRVFSGAIRFNRHNTQASPVAMTTIVTTGQVQLSPVDATVCVRAEGDRTSIAVMDGAVQVLALSGKAQTVASGREAAAGRGVFAMKLRAGDRAEIFKRGSDLVVRLESGNGVAGVCPLRWNWGFAVLERWVG